MIDLYQGDCLEVMKGVPDKSIDMVLCDLPYGTTRNKWDCHICLTSLWSEYKRIIKNNGAIVLFSQQPFTSLLVNSNLEMFKYEWIYQKDNGTGFLNAHYAPLKIHENILVFSKSSACYVKNIENAMTYNPQMRRGFKPYCIKQGSVPSSYDYKNIPLGHISKSNGERYPIDVIAFKRDKEKIHPAQKPIALLEYLIKTYTNENDLVLDNCMGSGSTGVACKNTNRNFIGIELDMNYFEIAKNRIGV